MRPWRDPGDLVVFETERPPRESDHVVIWLHMDGAEKKLVMIRQLLASKNPNKLRVHQHNPAKDVEIDLKKVYSIYRVLTWDECIR